MSSSKSKRMKNDSSSESLMPEDVIAILNTGMREGFFMDSLSLYQKKIDDSMMPELCERIIKLGDKVKELNLWDNQITSVGASMLFGVLKTNNSSMKVIHLNNNTQIDDECMKSLGEYIQSIKNIEATVLDGANISDAGVEMLAPYLYSNTTFKYLHLNDNKGITDKSIPLLIKMIESSCIEYISINNTSITQKNTIHASVACKGLKNGLTKVWLTNLEISDDDLLKICDAMKKYGIDKLNEIDLESNRITSKGASVLFDTLKEYNSVVSKLYFTNNQLDDECMKQLGEYLQDNEHVHELRLASNKITDKGVEILSEHLIGNTILTMLDLSHNEGITDASVPTLIETINRSYIMKLDLFGTPISEKMQQELNATISKPTKEREIPIKANTKSAAKIQLSSAST